MYTSYPQNNTYAPQYNGYQGYAPKQSMPTAAPVAQSAAASKGVLVVAGLAVVGAAAFGGAYLMNSSHDVQPAAAPAPAAAAPAPATGGDQAKTDPNKGTTTTPPASGSNTTPPANSSSTTPPANSSSTGPDTSNNPNYVQNADCMPFCGGYAGPSK